MSPSKSELAARRERLSKQIAGQRTMLAEAYRDLGKPLQYTQTAVKGVQMLRQNAWLLALSPVAVKLAFSFLGWKKVEKGRPGLLSFFRKGNAGTVVEDDARAASRRARPLLTRLLGHGVSAFKIYRRVRPFIPL